MERYGPPIYPIAVLSRPARKPRSGLYSLSFNNRQILEFNYLTLELARLNWGDFLHQLPAL
ncbi:MAG: hypothetical protein U0931_27485 [Vulcanimicrobiota bacterium]